ncbi:TetR/AcrR family transcriptional regulator [Planomonospora parontospora]|uniref:TetR/AcrR family transcriptional regulator n=1 Tax=Planomonospora parontospora TaxID=58119 RepID=UPI0016706B0C|nr:TetR/AcrR family transcriptional regulator [Planomonospora parontospora]GGL21443.1 TetR family transcriptional regulator [Planomonospora parontospora subsp. antibiotica]GII15786.1 TetR family transcriptional regulator [Planomonospora parontospora subsp. antibiotica]
MSDRIYQGMTPEERLADRRERLIDAGFALYGTLGFTSTTIEKLCMIARISNRAFYECFATREELLEVIYHRCVEQSVQVASQAAAQAPRTLEGVLEAGIEAYIRFITDDPRRAQIMYVERAKASTAYLAETVQMNAAAFFQVAGADLDLPDTVDPGMAARGLNGAMESILLEWVTAEDPFPIEQVIASVKHVFLRTLTP